MRERKYPVQLSEEQWNHLNSLLRQGQHTSRKLNPAGVLLYLQGKKDQEVTPIVGVGLQTGHNIRNRLAQQGPEIPLNEKPRPGASKKSGVKGEAYAIASAGSRPPAGRNCWTMQMIVDKLVRLKYEESIAAETVRCRLKKEA